MSFTFQKNNKQTKKPVDRFFENGASAFIQSLQTLSLHGMDYKIVKYNFSNLKKIHKLCFMLAVSYIIYIYITKFYEFPLFRTPQIFLSVHDLFYLWKHLIVAEMLPLWQ